MKKKILLGITALFIMFSAMFVPMMVWAGNPPDQQKSSISGAATPANGTSWSSVTIALRDANGNNLSAHDWITITSSSSSTSFDPSSATLDGSGTIYTKMRSTTVGNVNVTVTDNTTSTQITGTIIFYTPGTNPPASGSCTDPAPGSAPTLTSAVSADTNSVTLTWTAAVAPVTYYLVSYGTAPGNYQYGNPNIGGQGTTTYTVGGLATGTTYYFVIRPVNGCSPGTYSNELSAVAGGTPAPMATPALTPTSTPSPTISQTITPRTPTATPTTIQKRITPGPTSVVTQAPVPIETFPPLAQQPENSSLRTIMIIVTIVGILIFAGVGVWLYIERKKQNRPPPITYY